MRLCLARHYRAGVFPQKIFRADLEGIATATSNCSHSGIPSESKPIKLDPWALIRDWNVSPSLVETLIYQLSLWN
ncbi:hypothetical protein [Roseovarius spongiae]|uniref:hypothetical protein n=1 Tax=Roseovarius spongiae TaxID=2320272 RepID=UPI0011C3F9D8|nr:hypothetical protein [Roseovarius spongiae]